MITLILSSFDNIIGPKVFLKAPEQSESLYLDNIPLLMDLYQSGFFIHEFGDIKTANLIFEIYSPCARGRREILMISVASIKNNTYNLDMNSFKEILEFFAIQANNIKDLYKAFHCDEISLENKYCKEIIDFVVSFYQALPTERSIHDQIFSQVLTFRLSHEGKASILNNLQENLSIQSQSRNPISIPRELKF